VFFSQHQRTEAEHEWLLSKVFYWYSKIQPFTLDYLECRDAYKISIGAFGNYQGKVEEKVAIYTG